MSKNEIILTTVSDMLSYIKERAKIDIATASQKGLIDIDKNQALRIGNIVVASIEANFAKTVTQLENKLKE